MRSTGLNLRNVERQILTAFVRVLEEIGVVVHCHFNDPKSLRSPEFEFEFEGNKFSGHFTSSDYALWKDRGLRVSLSVTSHEGCGRSFFYVSYSISKLGKVRKDALNFKKKLLHKKFYDVMST